MESIQELLEARRQFGIRPGLDRMYALLKLLGNPEKSMPVIHIAGTNGKGSTLTYIKTALQKNGYMVGTFSSPALESFHEQIMINDVSISDVELTQLIQKIKPAVQRMDEEGNPPTEFEITVLLAFLHMQNKVDLAVIEAGMGGRDDSTNCVHPLLSIITNVEKDHVSYLGGTYEAIAFHKAGIIKPEVAVVTGRLHEEAQQVIKRTAEKNNARLYQLGKAFHYNSCTEHNGFSFQMVDRKVRISKLSMAGRHQIENASVALAALFVIQKKGWEINMDVAQTGVEEASVSGRFELVSTKPAIIIDSAHNPAGLHSFIQTVKALYPNQKKHLVFAVFQDKDWKGMITQLDTFSSITFTTFDHPRAASPKGIYDISKHPNKVLNPDWKKAIHQLQNNLSEKEMIFVVGSLHFIGKVRNWVDINKGR